MKSKLGEVWKRETQHFRWRIYGPRGVALLGLSIVAYTFGLAYAGPFSTMMATSRNTAMELLNSILPMSVWGILWCITGFHLMSSAFRVEQGKALGGLTGLFFIWGTSEVAAFIADLYQHRQTSGSALFVAVIYYGMMTCLLGLAKMVNPAESHIEVIEAPGPSGGAQ